MNDRINWIISECNKEPETTGDLYHLYNDYCSEFGHISEESYKRYCRSAMDLFSVETEMKEETEAVKQETLLKSKKQMDNNLEIALTSYEINSAEKLIEWADVDLNIWELYSQNIRSSSNLKNAWFICDCKFRLKDHTKISPEELLANFREMLADYESPTNVITPPKYFPSDNIGLLNLYDHHIGKRIHGEVTGNGKEWTTQLAKDSMIRAVDYFIDRMQDQVETVWFVMGQDILNMDNPQGTTTKGTPQPNDIDYRHLILESNELMITVFEKLLHYFKVEVIVVPGNHDFNTTFLLGEILKHHFLNNPNIEIDNGLCATKYRQHGEVFLGFVHGSEQIKKKYVLPMVMMQQRPESAQCRFKEFLTGHTHQTKRTQVTEVEEEYGVTLRTMPTLSPTCEWAAGKYFQGIQATECIIYNKEFGPIATYRYSE